MWNRANWAGDTAQKSPRGDRPYLRFYYPKVATNWSPLTESNRRPSPYHGHLGVRATSVGHTSTRTTEVVYRRELRPVINTGAEIMDKVFRAS
jgi:hypothetical protein